MAVHYVLAEEDVPEGGHAVVNIEGREIGIYQVNGEYHAILNYCPHQGRQSAQDWSPVRRFLRRYTTTNTAGQAKLSAVPGMDGSLTCRPASRCLATASG